MTTRAPCSPARRAALARPFAPGPRPVTLRVSTAAPPSRLPQPARWRG